MRARPGASQAQGVFQLGPSQPAAAGEGGIGIMGGIGSGNLVIFFFRFLFIAYFIRY